MKTRPDCNGDGVVEKGTDDEQQCPTCGAERAKVVRYFFVEQFLAPVNMPNADEIENDVAAFARSPSGGLIITGSGAAIRYRELIIALAARHKLPAIYFDRFFVADGGLISYGVDLLDQYRRAAGYIDRILKGEKPADMPVQAATKYELAINLKTAKALGLTVPPSLLARASEVIE